VARLSLILPLRLAPILIAGVGCANSAGADALSSFPLADSGRDAGATGREAGSSDGATAGPVPDSSPPPPACPPNSTAGFAPAPYTGAVAHQAFCTATEISAFVSACGDGSTAASCMAWVAANVTTDAGSKCGRCIIARKNNGGVWVDPKGLAYPNYAACIQLTDPAHGGACAAAYDYATSCNAVACDSCSAVDFAGCVAAAARGECSKDVNAEATACSTDFADGGAAQTCTPGTPTMTRDPDFTYIITLVCGP
jgi:hypothetical protein